MNKDHSLCKYGLLRYAQKLQDDFSLDALGFALAFAQDQSNDHSLPFCSSFDRFLCFLWALTLDFRVITKTSKKTKNTECQNISDRVLKIKNIWNQERFHSDEDDFCEEAYDHKSVFTTYHRDLFNKEYVPNQIVPFFKKYYDIADNLSIFPYTKENLLSKTENVLSYVAIDTNDLSDWISIPNFVIEHAIRLCISITERSKMEKLIMMLPHYNYYPQLSDSEEEFLDICTVAILKPEYGIDKWDIFCHSNQILVSYLTIKSPFKDEDIQHRIDMLTDMMCLQYSSQEINHRKKYKSFLPYIKSRSSLFSKLFCAKDIPDFMIKLKNINKVLSKVEPYPFRESTNRLTKIVFGSYYASNFEDHEDMGENLDEDDLIWINLKSAELFLPCNAWNVDATLALTLLKNQGEVTDEMFTAILAFIYLYNKKVPIPSVLLPECPYDYPGFEFLKQVPDIQRDIINKYQISTDQWFYLNAMLQICSNYNIFGFRANMAGISSPHLQGTVTPVLKNFLRPKNQMIDNKKFPFKKEVLAFLKINHPFFRNINPDTDLQDIDQQYIYTSLKTDVGAVMIPDSAKEGDDIDPNEKQIRVQMKNEREEKIFIWLPLETVLAIIFPLIFFCGPPPPLRGETFREKFQFLFSMHPWFRTGMLAENLIVFAFDLITKAESMFYICNKARQRLKYPKNAIRLESDYRIMPPKDPSYALYWKNFERQVLGMTCAFGYPTYMITLTFNDKWNDCKFMKDLMRKTFHKGKAETDLRFDPLSSLLIFEKHKQTIFSENLEPLIVSMGLSGVTHYAIRLEFQSRGAPHVHALVWTTNCLDEEIVQQTIFAEAPLDLFPILQNIVIHNMVHKCTDSYCRQKSNKCRFGFPKTSSPVTRYDDTSGKWVFKRNKKETMIVEHCPTLIMAWHGHAHALLLKNDHITPELEKVVFYVGKYHSKAEPIEKVSINKSTLNADKNCQDDIFKMYLKFLNARIIGPEEALARIFSLNFTQKDVEVKYIVLNYPSERQGVFNTKTGVKVGLDPIDWYYHRPLAFEGFTILEFFAKCEIKAKKVLIGVVENDQRPIHERGFGTLIPNADGDFEYEENLDRSAEFGTHYDFLLPMNCESVNQRYCYLRRQPRVVLFNKGSVFDDIEHLAYLLLLLSSCWRSDEEILANQQNYVSACIYHGISLEIGMEEVAHVQLCIKYMFTGHNFLSLQIAKNLSILRKENVSDILIQEELKKYENDIRYSTVMAHLDNIITFENEINQMDNDPDSTITPDIANRYIHYSFTDQQKIDAQTELEKQEKLMNDQQKSVMDIVKYAFQSSNNQIMQYIDGKAGTGKSFVIRAIQNFCTIHNIPYLTCASTGIAASLIGGSTAHSSFILFPDKEDQNVMHSSLNPSSVRGKCIDMVKLIIIDEITMLNKGSINAINAGLSRLKTQLHGASNQNSPFGGKHILLFGDLSQITAVVPHADDYAITANQFFQSDIFDKFHISILEKCERQSSDEKELLFLLDSIRSLRIRDGCLKDDALQILKDHYISNIMDEDVAVDWHSQIQKIHEWMEKDYTDGMIIAFENAIVDRINHSILGILSNEQNSYIYQIEASFYANESCYVSDQNEHDVERGKNRFKLVAADFLEINYFKQALRKRKTTCIVPMTLHLMVNCRIMLLKNIDVSMGLVNGARGTVHSIIGENGVVKTLMIKFDGHDDLVPIIKCRVHSYILVTGKEIYAYQFPLKLCYGVTSHKSQGQTLKKAAIYIGKPIPGHGCFYTACSRVRTIEGILFWGYENESENNKEVSFHMNMFIVEEHDHMKERANIDETVDIIPDGIEDEEEEEEEGNIISLTESNAE